MSEDKNETTDNSYKVGYKRPPNDKKYKKGKSGNPSGRPKEDVGFYTYLRQALERQVIYINVDGKRIKITGEEAFAAMIVNGAFQDKKLQYQTVLEYLQRKDTKMGISSEEINKHRTILILPAKDSIPD